MDSEQAGKEGQLPKTLDIVQETKPEAMYHRFKRRMEELNTTLDTQAKTKDRETLDKLAKDIEDLKLQVQDAAASTPDHDAALFAREITAFKARLQTARSATVPNKGKFSFKSGKKITSPPPAASVMSEPTEPFPALDSAVLSDSNDDLEGDDDADALKVDQDPRYEDLSYKHLITDVSVNGVLSHLTHSIVDLRHPSRDTLSRHPGGLTIKNVRGSLLILGRVEGATHVTDARNTVLVVETNQLRLHECRDVSVYVLCASRPIIEGCTGMSFAPLPMTYIGRTASILAHTPEDLKPKPIEENKWDQVDDFSWLKQGVPNPNFRILREEEGEGGGQGGRIQEKVWRDVVPGDEHVGLTDVLKAVGIKGAERRRSRRGSETCGGGF